MKVVDFRKFGPPEVLRVETWPKPERKPGEVLVNLGATSVNPVDCKIRSGKFAPPLLTKLPKIPGGDVSGYVAEADPHSKFRIGERVFGLADTFAFWRKEGSYAQFLAVNEQWLTQIPDSIDMQQAGAAPLVALTAYQALEPANLKPGQNVLIHAGAGGVGHVAIQLAKNKGARVATTCSAKHADFCRKLGADVILDYSKDRFERIYKDQPFDVIVDSVGGKNWLRSMQVLKTSGYFAHIMSGAWVPGLPFIINAPLEGVAAFGGYVQGLLRGPRYKMVFVQPNGSQMAACARLMQEGKLRIYIDRVFPLDRASDAHRAWEAGHGPGKLSISMEEGKMTAPAI